MVGPILDDHAADGSPYARRCLILGLVLAWLISPACVTFRCEVLSEGKTVAHRRYYASLNTPFGARYFPTDKEYYSKLRVLSQSQCTFWCLVLSDRCCTRRQESASWSLNAPFGAWCFPTQGEATNINQIAQSQCTFWCLVLSDWRLSLDYYTWRKRLNALSGAWCFPTGNRLTYMHQSVVSMHLLVLGAFRPQMRNPADVTTNHVSMHLLVLGAFRRGRAIYGTPVGMVSMHLLVLGAFRPDSTDLRGGMTMASQCTFWCLVLSDRS